MPNKLQKARASRETEGYDKHIPAEGSQEWSVSFPPPEERIKYDVTDSYLVKLYMGMCDMKRWLHELEEWISGQDEMPSLSKLFADVRDIRSVFAGVVHLPENLGKYLLDQEERIKNLEKRLEDALRED